MVARGDLGVEIGPRSCRCAEADHHRALERGKPVITATQMLESMIEQSEPDARRGERRRERDPRRHLGGDALRRDAVGAYPVESVAYMDRIARASRAEPLPPP
jgi:pyruvate kinase